MLERLALANTSSSGSGVRRIFFALRARTRSAQPSSSECLADVERVIEPGQVTRGQSVWSMFASTAKVRSVPAPTDEPKEAEDDLCI